MTRSKFRVLVATAATALAVTLPTVPAFASTSFTPPPGCTGTWNTTQSGAVNHAPGTAVGCGTAMLHA